LYIYFTIIFFLIAIYHAYIPVVCFCLIGNQTPLKFWRH